MADEEFLRQVEKEDHAYDAGVAYGASEAGRIYKQALQNIAQASQGKPERLREIAEEALDRVRRLEEKRGSAFKDTAG